MRPIDPRTPEPTVPRLDIPCTSWQNTSLPLQPALTTRTILILRPLSIVVRQHRALVTEHNLYTLLSHSPHTVNNAEHATNHQIHGIVQLVCTEELAWRADLLINASLVITSEPQEKICPVRFAVVW